jgi:hypothetical protein
VKMVSNFNGNMVLIKGPLPLRLSMLLGYTQIALYLLIVDMAVSLKHSSVGTVESKPSRSVQYRFSVCSRVSSKNISGTLRPQ